MDETNVQDHADEVLGDIRGEEWVATSPEEGTWLQGSYLYLSADGNRIVYIDASTGCCWIGANGKNGRIFLGPKSMTGSSTAFNHGTRIYYNGILSLGSRAGKAISGAIFLYGSNKQRISLDGINGNLKLGGNGTDGDIYLFPKNAKPSEYSKAAIHLDAATGDIKLSGADCAERFFVPHPEKADPGTVLIIEDEEQLRPSDKPYDTRVIGVVSGGGDLRPGIVLGKDLAENRSVPIALNGKVHCKVDARFGSIEVGDLLTTSETPGFAMKAQDPSKAFGAVIGKALKGHADGCGTIPILVSLH